MEGKNQYMSLRAENLSFGYNTESTILNSLSVTVPKGKITALIGRNGCGKSTLLKLLNRLLEPRSGSIFLEDTVREGKKYSHSTTVQTR